MAIRDITPDFFRFWGQAQGRSPDEQLRLWRDYYEEPNRLLFSASGGRHGSTEYLPAALERLEREMPSIRASLPVIRAAMERIGPPLAQLFTLDRLDVSWVLLVGMYWSDGWMVDVEGTPTCFVAAEMLESPERIEMLLAHEAAHAAHAACLGDEWKNLTTLADDLFSEGLATQSSARLAPEYDEVAYLWAGQRETWRGLDVFDWLALCEIHWPVVQADLVRNLGSTDANVTSRYFLGNHAPQEMPERIGYFAGYRLLTALANDYSVAELARWPSERIGHELAQLI